MQQTHYAPLYSCLPEELRMLNQHARATLLLLRHLYNEERSLDDMPLPRIRLVAPSRVWEAGEQSE